MSFSNAFFHRLAHHPLPGIPATSIVKTLITSVSLPILSQTLFPKPGFHGFYTHPFFNLGASNPVLHATPYLPRICLLFKNINGAKAAIFSLFQNLDVC